MINNLVSIIIPVYNTENYLKQCIESALNQTYDNTEIILVDDGSTDSSGLICDEYVKKDNRIRVIHKPNGGQSSARNIALDVATGKYVYFLDSDDYILPDLIKKLVDIAEANDADIVFFEATSFVDNDNFNESVLDYFNYTRNHIYSVSNSQMQFVKLVNNNEYFVCTPLHFYKKQYLVSNSIRFEEGIIHEDNLFSARVYLNNGITAHLHSQEYMRRLRNDSTMTSESTEHKVFKYTSLVRVYYEVVKEINLVNPIDAIALILINDCVNACFNSYNSLSKEMQNEYIALQKRLKRHVFWHFGKYDYRLARKCASPLLTPIVRGTHFVYERIKLR